MKKDKFISYYDFLKEENKKLTDENKRLKLRNEMLELINFHLIRKEYINEKS